MNLNFDMINGDDTSVNMSFSRESSFNVSLNEQSVNNSITDTESNDTSSNSLTISGKKCYEKYVESGFFELTDLPCNSSSSVLMCKLCDKKLTISYRTNSNIMRHLKTTHPERFPEIYELVNEDTLRIRSSTKKLKVDDRQNKICLLKMVVQNVLPMSFLESSGFRDVIRSVPSTFKVPCRQTMTQFACEVHLEVKQMIIKQLENVDYVCATADFWSIHKKSYLGVTVHWIDTLTLERRSAAISCNHIPGQHTQDVIASKLESLFAEFGLSGKVVATITDNASNFEAAFNTYGYDNDDNATYENNEDIIGMNPVNLSDMAVDLHGLPKHRRCAAHTLNLVATKDVRAAMLDENYKKIYESINKKLQNLWGKQSRSNIVAEKIKTFFGRYFKTQIVTRWNSFYAAMEDIASKSLNDLNLVMQDLCHGNTITESEYSFIKEFVKVMEPIAIGVEVLQEESYMYLGWYTPTIRGLIQQIRGVANLEFCSPLKDAVLSGIISRFSDVDDIINLKASFLHPFHKNYTHNYDNLHLKEDIIRMLSDELCSIWNDVDEINNSLPKDPSARTAMPQPHHLKIFAHTTSDVVPLSVQRNVIQNFILDRSTEDFDIFFNKCKYYDKLKPLFIKYNTSLPSSAPVERLFSGFKDILRAKRSNLTGEHFEEQLLLNVNESYINKLS